MRIFKKNPTEEDPCITICISDDGCLIEQRAYTIKRKLLGVTTFDISSYVKKPRGAYLTRDYITLIVIDGDYTKFEFTLYIPGDITTACFSDSYEELKCN